MYDFKRGLLRITFVIILAAVSSLNNIFAQKSQSVATRQSATEAFTQGNYEQAYNDFRQLLLKYPKDPLYKYYAGASLVQMKKNAGEALNLLQQSLNGAFVVKTLPPDVLFYLGRAQQMSGKFTEAIASYSSYTDQVGRKVSREQGVPGYIQECENKKGMITATVAISPGVAATEKSEINKPADQPVISNSGKKSAEKENSGKQDLPLEYENMLDEALKLQYKADSLNQLADEQKKQLDKLPEQERAAFKMKISQNEMLAASYQKTADMKYGEAQAKMNPQPETLPKRTESQPKPSGKEPLKAEEAIIVSGTAAQADTMKKVAPVTGNTVGTTVIFEVLPKEAAYPDEKIKIDPEVPAGLIYRIQLAVFRNPVAPSIFKGITPVYGFKVSGTDKTNYYAGMFRRSSDAKKALQQVKEAGFRDAFIVAISDKKPVSADRAAVLENEWGTKPFFDLAMPGAAIDTIPPALAFRVEVIRSLKPLKADAVETLRTIAGSRGLDILHLTDGNIVYLIGKFITFESAAEYADLLKRNNYRLAKVVAWLGNKEVPVETARQLFNDLE